MPWTEQVQLGHCIHIYEAKIDRECTYSYILYQTCTLHQADAQRLA